jgi:hypothetical protein
MNSKIIKPFLIIGAFFVSGSLALANPTPPDTSHTPSKSDDLSVFLDLKGWADKDYIRQEISIVEYVRDKEFADVHVILSKHDAGQAGTNYFISFTGNGQFQGMDNELRYWSAASETEHETRQGYTKMIKIGLAPYLANIRGMASNISLNYKKDSLREGISEKLQDDDPWNDWIFKIYGGGYFNSEQTQNSLHIRYGFFADKVTREWKIRARPYSNYNERNYGINGETVKTITHRGGFDGYLIKSLTDRWSAGLFTEMFFSTFHNMDFQVEVSPAVEYSIFPYEEATRRYIAVAYKVDYAYNDYIMETVFGKTQETLWGHSLVLSADFRQPWGSIEAGINASHHFHDFSSNSIEFISQLNLRIFKGFSLTLEADFEFINNLVAIPMEKLSKEEILLEQRRRATDYQFEGHIGFTYTFGSDQSAEFNPRLGE